MANTPTLSPDDRVTHANKHRSYGGGVITRIVPTLSSRPACKGYVRFDGERADRLVWLGDLTPVCASAPVPRIVYSARSADLPQVVA